MAYVDGFVQAVPTERKADYIAHAQAAAAVFKSHGALNLVECWGNDVPEGTLTSFPLSVQCRPDETVVFSWIWWPSKAVRDSGMAAAMADERLSAESNPMPFDGSRMIYAGFDVVVGA